MAFLSVSSPSLFVASAMLACYKCTSQTICTCELLSTWATFPSTPPRQPLATTSVYGKSGGQYSKWVTLARPHVARSCCWREGAGSLYRVGIALVEALNLQEHASLDRRFQCVPPNSWYPQLRTFYTTLASQLGSPLCCSYAHHYNPYILEPESTGLISITIDSLHPSLDQAHVARKAEDRHQRDGRSRTDLRLSSKEPNWFIELLHDNKILPCLRDVLLRLCS
jgi:hypothetical protein